MPDYRSGRLIASLASGATVVPLEVAEPDRTTDRDAEDPGSHLGAASRLSRQLERLQRAGPLDQVHATGQSEILAAGSALDRPHETELAHRVREHCLGLREFELDSDDRSRHWRQHSAPAEKGDISS